MMVSGTPAGPPPSGATKALWYKSSTGVYSDNGTTLQTTNGGTIQQWNDQSGNGRNANNAGGFSKPSLDTGTTHNGNNSIRFGAAAMSLTIPVMNGVFNGTTGAEVFLVLKAVSANDAAQHPVLQFSANGGGGLGDRYPDSSGNLATAFGRQSPPGFLSIGAPGVDISTQFRVYNVAAKTNFVQVQLDGTQLLSSTAAYTFSAPSTNAQWLGIDSVGGWFNGWVAEVLLYIGILNSTERAATVAYLQTGTGSPT